MAGHGHVIPNLDGTVARCGGPAFCAECALEAHRNASSHLSTEQRLAALEDLVLHLVVDLWGDHASPGKRMVVPEDEKTRRADEARARAEALGLMRPKTVEPAP